MSEPTRNRLRDRLSRWASGVAAVALVAAGLSAGVPGTAHADNPPYSAASCATRPTTPIQGQPWQTTRLRYADLHKIATGKGVKVAVIDTGVFPGGSAQLKAIDLLPPLSPASTEKRLSTGKDKDGKPTEGFDCLHGTMVVSLLAAAEDPNTHFSGIAPGVTVLPIRSLQSSSRAPNEPAEPIGPTVDAFEAAIAARVDIISISQQSGVDYESYRQVVEKAIAAGILVVAAAGNNGPSGGPAYPAAYPGVMAVGMTNAADQPDRNSQSDPKMTVSVGAPGSNVVGMLPLCMAGQANCPPNAGPAYMTDTGTSFATPIVAGAAALVMERYPDLTAAQVKKLLEDTADMPVDGPGNAQIGHGIINPYRALVGPAPVPSPSAQPTGAGIDHIPPYQPDTNVLQRNTALAVAGVSLGVVAVAGVVAAALPSGRRRRWRPARR